MPVRVYVRAALQSVSLVGVVATGLSLTPPPTSRLGGLLSCADTDAYIARSRFTAIALALGSGAVVATWSSVSCGSLLCDALLSHLTIIDSTFTNCRWVVVGGGGFHYLCQAATTSPPPSPFARTL